MAIRAVVFDLDNTLYDYNACNYKAEEQLVRTISGDFKITQDEARDLLKNAKRNIKKQLGENVAASHNRLLYMQNICEQKGKNPLIYALKFYDTYWNTILDNMVLFDYVMPLLDSLIEKGIKIGILTDLTAYIQYRKLKKLGLTEKIDYLVTSEEAGAEKPSEKMFNLMIKKLGVKPEEIIMIGDSEKKDILGAEALGMKAVLIDVNKENILQKIVNLVKQNSEK